MNIGIIRSDRVLAEFVPQHGDYPDMFRALLTDPRTRSPETPAPTFVDIDGQAQAFPAPSACDGYVITGSRHSVYDDLPWIAPVAGFVGAALAAGRPVVGICFGHQLIAQYFGGETRAAATGWCVGVQRARVVAREPWMRPAASELRLLASHQDQVVRLPPDARPFAAGHSCPQAGFVLRAGGARRAEALTFQGHPEFSRGYAAALLASREATLGADVYRAGMASLDEATNADVVATWMLDFLARGG